MSGPRHTKNDKYDIKEQIGKGSFGSAFLVRHKETKVNYVMKKIRLARQTENQRRASLREMQIVSALKHPFIVQHFECWLDRGHTVCIVARYCEYGDLNKLIRRLRRGRVIEENQLKNWLAQLGLALNYLHQNNVLHRDIKPSNIFVTSDGNLQLGDFGLAKILDEPGQKAQSMVGTPNYMSPEVIQNRPYDFKSDIWSLGCVFYELSALRPAFSAFNMDGLITKIAKSTVAILPPQFSKEWNTLVRSMLRKNPVDRPTIEDILVHDILEEWIDKWDEHVTALLPDLSIGTLTRAKRLSSPSPTSPGSKPFGRPQSSRNESNTKNVIRNLNAENLNASLPENASSQVNNNSPPYSLELELKDSNDDDEIIENEERVNSSLDPSSNRTAKTKHSPPRSPGREDFIQPEGAVSNRETSPQQSPSKEAWNPLILETPSPSLHQAHDPILFSLEPKGQNEDLKKGRFSPPSAKKTEQHKIDTLQKENSSLKNVLSLAASLYQRQRLTELGQVLSSYYSYSLSDLTNASMMSPDSGMQLGDRVIVGRSRRLGGVIKYIGPTAFADGEWTGIELDTPDGKNSGEVKGVRYFTCQQNCGVFVRSSLLRPDAESEA